MGIKTGGVVIGMAAERVGDAAFFKLGEVVNYVTTGMDGSNSLFMLVMNRDSWDGLDADTQAKLEGMTGADMSWGGHITMSTSGVKALEKWEAAGGEVTVSLDRIGRRERP